MNTQSTYSIINNPVKMSSNSAMAQSLEHRGYTGAALTLNRPPSINNDIMRKQGQQKQQFSTNVSNDKATAHIMNIRTPLPQSDLVSKYGEKQSKIVQSTSEASIHPVLLSDNPPESQKHYQVYEPLSTQQQQQQRQEDSEMVEQEEEEEQQEQQEQLACIDDFDIEREVEKALDELNYGVCMYMNI